MLLYFHFCPVVKVVNGFLLNSKFNVYIWPMVPELIDVH